MAVSQNKLKLLGVATSSDYRQVPSSNHRQSMGKVSVSVRSQTDSIKRYVDWEIHKLERGLV